MCKLSIKCKLSICKLSSKYYTRVLYIAKETASTDAFKHDQENDSWGRLKTKIQKIAMIDVSIN